MEKLLDYFEPNHYELNFDIDKSKKLLKGKTIIKGLAKSSTIKLHAKFIEVESILIDGNPVNYQLTTDIITIDSPKTDHISVEVNYTHQLNSATQGAYLSTYNFEGKTEIIVATQFESHYARECFPCIDEPAAKATFDILITTDPSDTVISNMPQKSLNEKTRVFDTTPIMSTYLVAFAIGKFKSIETTSKHGIKVTSYISLAQPEDTAKFANDFAAKCLDFYDDIFNVPYPLPKLDQVALPDFESGAMENWGLVTYREQCLLCDASSALDQKLYVATVIAHELSHQWFGNLVTMNWWDDLWLNESFASLMEIYAVDKIDPTFNAWDNFYSGTIMPALRRDCISGVQPVKCEVNNPAEIATLFDGAIVYAKGARLMFMLHRIMGADAFFAGLTDYFNKHAYKNTVAYDLWDALTPHANFDVKDLMTPWLEQPGYPVLTDGSQERFLITKDTSDQSFVYPIPKIKDDLSGHYLINLPPAEFNAALNDFSNKTTEQKLRLLIDHQLLAKTPRVSSVELLKLLEKFKNETEYIIWDILSFIISDLKIFIPPNSDTEYSFKKFVENLAETQYLRLGLTKKYNEPDNDTKLRPIILGFMLYANNSDFKNLVSEQFGQTQPSEIDSNIRPTILSALLKANDDQITNPTFSVENLLDLYKNTPDPEFQSDLMAALTSSKNSETLASFFPLLKDGTVRTSNVLFFFYRLARNSTSTKIALNWLYENWDYLYEIEGDKTISDYPRLAAACIRNEAIFQSFHEFFAPKICDPALGRTLEIAFDEISARLDLIAADGPSVISALS